MQSELSHMQINVRPENMSFYKDLAAFLGWKTLYEAADVLGVAGTNDASLWFSPVANDANNDYDGGGVNHLGIGVTAQADVDTAAAWLKERGVELLFETPRHRPEFSSGEGLTYYQVMFESPDRILWEVVYTGPKAG
jgi:hypothetical protein